MKSLRFPDAQLFEVRWQDVSALGPLESGKRENIRLCIRMIFAEPAVLVCGVVGLHAHEKRLEPHEGLSIARQQDAEIELAARLFIEGEASEWGVKFRRTH